MKTSILFVSVCVFMNAVADDHCGIPKIPIQFHEDSLNEDIGYIVGGDEAVPHSHPWMVRSVLSQHC